MEYSDRHGVFKRVSDLICSSWRCKVALDTGFVRKSAGLALGSIRLIAIVPFLTSSRRKWNLRSMCLVLKPACLAELLASLMQPSLSSCTTIGWLIAKPKTSSTSVLHHRTSLTASPAALYSASVVDKVTVGCFLDFHPTTFPFHRTIRPLMDLLVVGQVAQSASTYALRPDSCDSAVKVIPTFAECWR